MLKKTDDTSSQFYSNIDKLIKLINVSLEKEQVKNAEKYINYFFSVMIRFYQKSSKSSKITTKAEFSAQVTSNVDIETNGKGGMETNLPERSIKNVFGDFFTDKIMKILADNIRNEASKFFILFLDV